MLLCTSYSNEQCDSAFYRFLHICELCSGYTLRNDVVKDFCISRGCFTITRCTRQLYAYYYMCTTFPWILTVPLPLTNAVFFNVGNSHASLPYYDSHTYNAKPTWGLWSEISCSYDRNTNLLTHMWWLYIYIYMQIIYIHIHIYFDISQTSCAVAKSQ